MAVPFDVDRLEISSSPVPVLEGIRSPGIRGGAQFAVSRTGTLAYLPGLVDESASRLVWVSRLGVAEPLPAPPRQYEYPRVSPDGQRVAVALGDIWVYDVARDGLSMPSKTDLNAIFMVNGVSLTAGNFSPLRIDVRLKKACSPW